MPPEAVKVAVSLDGDVPMKDGVRTQKRQEAQEQGKHTASGGLPGGRVWDVKLL